MTRAHLAELLGLLALLVCAAPIVWLAVVVVFGRRP